MENARRRVRHGKLRVSGELSSSFLVDITRRVLMADVGVDIRLIGVRVALVRARFEKYVGPGENLRPRRIG